MIQLEKTILFNLYLEDFLQSLFTMVNLTEPIIIEDSIVFKDISFKHLNANAHSLENINLSIKNHEKIAIVGLGYVGLPLAIGFSKIC